MSTSPARVLSRPRFALLVLIGVYPVITGLLYLVLPFLGGQPIWVITAVVAPMMVGVMVWGLIPAIQKQFAGFITVPAKG